MGKKVKIDRDKIIFKIRRRCRMRKVTWTLSGGLTCSEIEQIHNAALQMIDETGILVSSKNAINILKGQQGVRIYNGNRVRISPQRVVEILGPFPKRPFIMQEKESFFISGYSLRCFDPETGRIRSSTAKDLVDFTKIAHALGVKGCAIVMPQDMPQKLAEVATYKLCLDVSDRIYGAGIFSDAQVYDIV